jgi:tripartite-type tricarboxylate transporter receptor subunit TctC
MAHQLTSFVTRGLDPRVHLFREKMDCRVKPGNDSVVTSVGAALVVIAILCMPLLPAPASAQPQPWPTRPVRIVNTFAPGGAADILARTVAEGLGSAFGQPFFVETRAGAAGAIGVQAVAAMPPDGYSFVITNVSILVLAPISNPRLGYAPLRDLVNIAYIAGSPIVFSVNPSLGVKTLDQFIAYGKKSGDPLTYSSSGVGSMGQLFAESFAQRAGIAVEHVPYKGASQGLLDLIGGHIAFAAQTVGSTAGQLRAGSLTGIAQSAGARLPDFPDLPTFKELGYPELVSTTWFSLSGPAGLPADIVQKVNREIINTMARPQTQQRMREEGMVTEGLTPAEFRNLIETETVRWKPVLERAGLIEK